MEGEVVLLDNWASIYAMRVRIALAEKGVPYQKKDEFVGKKSELLKKMNPVHQQLPVLIHKGKPVCKSLIIVQYIDEVWREKSPLLPSDPYQRARARFWADFIDKKVYDPSRKIWATKGQEQDAAKKDFIDALRTLEGELGDKPYFGGKNFGFVDVAFIGFYSWFSVYETFGSFTIEVECPMISQWAKRCVHNRASLKDAQTLPEQKEVHELAVRRRKELRLE